MASIVVFAAPLFGAVDPNPQRSSVAMSPQDSLKQIVVDPGLKVELVASEPNVMSPVAVRFDEDGRMWVVEMCDYPTGPTKKVSAAVADFDSDRQGWRRVF